MNQKITSACISVIIPVYGCKECLYELYIRLISILEKLTSNFEIILVDDCSLDNPWLFISDLGKKDLRVKGIRLSKNFGQHQAISAGLDYSSGEWIVVMDCDLQDKPEEIVNLYNKAIEGYDFVLGRRSERKDPFIKKIFSRLFYKLLGYLTDTKQDSAVGNFGIYNRKVIDAICSMKDNFRYFPTMVCWVGFNHTQINIDHAQREIGKTSYSFKKLMRLGLEVIVAFSDKPLRLTVKAGIAISIFALIFAGYTFVQYLSGAIKVLGYTSLFISIWLLAGLIIFLLGMVGLYIGRTFENVKGRPIYIINEKVNVG